MSWLRFEPSTSRIRVKGVTVTPTRSVKKNAVCEFRRFVVVVRIFENMNSSEPRRFQIWTSRHQVYWNVLFIYRIWFDIAEHWRNQSSFHYLHFKLFFPWVQTESRFAHASVAPLYRPGWQRREVEWEIGRETERLVENLAHEPPWDWTKTSAVRTAWDAARQHPLTHSSAMGSSRNLGSLWNIQEQG